MASQLSVPVGKREHRTEVTEVTEGDLRLGAKGLRVNSGILCEKQAKRREHRTEVTEVTEVKGGFSDWGRKVCG